MLLLFEDIRCLFETFTGFARQVMRESATWPGATLSKSTSNRRMSKRAPIVFFVTAESESALRWCHRDITVLSMKCIWRLIIVLINAIRASARGSVLLCKERSLTCFFFASSFLLDMGDEDKCRLLQLCSLERICKVLWDGEKDNLSRFCSSANRYTE